MSEIEERRAALARAEADIATRRERIAAAAATGNTVMVTVLTTALVPREAEARAARARLEAEGAAPAGPHAAAASWDCIGREVFGQQWRGIGA